MEWYMRQEPAEENVDYLYRQIGSELGEELSTLEMLTDLIQIFKDNELVALREIYENSQKPDQHAKELQSNAG